MNRPIKENWEHSEFAITQERLTKSLKSNKLSKNTIFWSSTCMQFSLWHSMHSTLLPRAEIVIWNDGILGLFTFTDMGRGHIFIRPMQY